MHPIIHLRKNQLLKVISRSDGHVNVALSSNREFRWGIHHFGFQVSRIKAVEKTAQTTAIANTPAVVAESWIRDREGNPEDISEDGWPV